MATNKLIQDIIEASGNSLADTLDSSKIMNEKDFITTTIPALNIALSGEIDGGTTPGLLMIAGKSKHFKTLYMLLIAKNYLDTYKDAIMVLFDSEFGAALNYFSGVGIDPKRVVHIPITDIEALKTQASNVLQKIERGNKVFVAIDSVGNLASKKEVDDALEGKSVADMTRAKQLKSLGRIITPHLTIKDIPLVIINHTYEEIGMFPKTIVGGGTGLYYSANDIWIIGRSQEKDGTETTGFKFTINIEKSRTVKEKSKIPVVVDMEKGIDVHSALLDIALESGHIVKPKNGWYQLKGTDKNVREADTGPLLDKLVKDQSFKDFVKEKYKQTARPLIQIEDIEDDEE